MNLARGLCTTTLALLLSAPGSWAQNPPAAAKTTTDTTTATTTKPAQNTSGAAHCEAETSGAERTFYLNNTVQQFDQNEIVTAMRNTLDPCDKVYLLASQNAIVMRASPDNLALAQKLLNDLDRPKKTYRVTFTVTEMEDGKRVGSQRFAMVAASGQKTTLKQDSRVPIPTGHVTEGVQTQFSYMDVGINFDATLDEFNNGVRLRSLIDQSAVVSQDKVLEQPVIRHVTLEGASVLALGKPMMLGSIDVPGSTRRLDVEVVVEQVP